VHDKYDRAYFTDAFANGATLEPRGKMNRRCTCTICGEGMDEGADKFSFRYGADRMIYHVHPECGDKITRK
jgi:hypothetical protein